MSVDKLLLRLDHCKSTGNQQWHARCPAHDDHSPSLSIKSLADGRILIHCHAGCGSVEVIEAVGLNMSDLFPPDDHYPGHRQKAKGANFNELVLSTGRSALKKGMRLTEAEKQDMRVAYIALQRSH